jgi:hypothetical protein
MDTGYPFYGLMIGTLFLAVGLLCMLRPGRGVSTIQADVGPFHLRINTSFPGLGFAALGVIVIFLTQT